MSDKRWTRIVGILLVGLHLSTNFSAAEANPVSGSEAYVGFERSPRSSETRAWDSRTFENAVNTAGSAHVTTVISIPAFSFQELDSDSLKLLPNLAGLLDHSALGAMNIRTSSRGLQSVYVSLGAGAPSSGTRKAQAFGVNEWLQGATAGELRSRYTGWIDRQNGNIVIPDWEALLQANPNRLTDAVPGMLGSLLKESGIRRFVLGNCDLGTYRGETAVLRRYGASMVIDEKGVAGSGEIGDNTLVSAADRPFGVKTNYAELLKHWEKNSESTGAALTLIEFGDLYRLYADRSHYREERFSELKALILSEIDTCIGQLAAKMRQGDSLWIFSPEVHADAWREKALLSPLLHIQQSPGRSGGGSELLMSESTRRSGVVTMQDFTATLLSEFGIPLPSGMTGTPITHIGHARALDWMLRDTANMQTVYRLRPWLLYSFVTYEVVVLLGSLLYILATRFAVNRHRHDRRKRLRIRGMGPVLIRFFLISILAAPVLLLAEGWLTAPLTGLLGINGAIAAWIAVFILGAAGLAYCLKKLSLCRAMIVLGCGTSALITADCLMGSGAMKYSALGYDPMIGARYYGIGNEFMGVLIGALVLGVTAALQRRYAAGEPAPWLPGTAAPPAGAEPEIAAAAEVPAAALPARTDASLACAAFLLVTAALAAPSLGANAGGALSAAVAFGTAGVRCFAGGAWRELRWGRTAVLLAALLALGLAALWLANSADSPAAMARESHVGRAFDALREGRFDQIGHLIVRKLRMNLHLIGVSAWSKVLLTSLFVMAAVVLRPRGRLALWQHKYPYWMYGFSANSLGAIAALLLNDSGIVAAATMIVYVAVPMLLLRLEEQAYEIGSSHSL